MSKEEKRHPKDEANFVSLVTLWWIFGLLRKGYTSPLQHQDLPSVRHEDLAEHLTKRLQEKWENEKRYASQSKTNPRLWKAVLRFFTWKNNSYFILLGLMAIISDNLVWFSTFKLLDLVLSGEKTRSQGVVYILGMGIGHLVKCVSINHFFLQGAMQGVRARAAVVGLLYKKLLRVSKASMDDGIVMELVCDDSQRLATSGEWFVQQGVLYFLTFVCAMCWLFYFVGWQIIPAILLLVSVSLYRFFIAKVDYSFRRNASRLAEERVGCVREILTGIHSIRMNCLEDIFEEKIQRIRWKETKFKTKRWFIMTISDSFLIAGKQLGTFITIVLLMFTGRESLSYHSVLPIMILISPVVEAFCLVLPTTIRLATDVYSSLQRIQDFLESRPNLAPHLQHCTHDNQSFENTAEKSDAKHDPLNIKISEENVSPKIPYLKLNDVTCKLPSLRTTSLEPAKSNNLLLLNYITLNVLERGLLLITGPVGSGKSSLLACALDGELLVTNGTVECSGNLAYVSDSPWIFPGTIRENILFGLPFNEEWYLKTLKVCQLEMDFTFFPQGDMCRVGEHGATISGGQRARIALARAVYSKADIYLLDDPLSSLDAKVAERIFKDCFRGLLAERIVLLTATTSRYLKEADYIVKLKNGVIVAKGNFDSVKHVFTDIEFGDDQRDVMSAEALHLESFRVNPAEEIEQNGRMSESYKEAEEDHETGNVSFTVYIEYFLNGAPGFVLLLLVFVFFSGQGLIVLADFMVSRLPNLLKKEPRSYHAIITYSVPVAAGVLLILVGTLWLYWMLMHAVYVIHNKMTACLLRASLLFHTTNPVGRILNRFSQDINNLDELFPFFLNRLCNYASPVLSSLILACITNVVLIPVVLVTMIVFFLTTRFYLRSALNLKRLMTIAGGPLYSHFSNTMEGVRTIRVHKRQNDFEDDAYSLINMQDQGLFAYYTAVRWLAITVDMVCVGFVMIVCIVMFTTTDSSQTALAVVTILYANNTVQNVQYIIRVFVEVHSQMTSAERTLAYTKLKAEKGRDAKDKPPSSWPRTGTIQFKNVSLSHYEGGPKVLRNLSFDIKSREKIGIAGRTGAGKSSLVAALMQMAETDGEIIVGGVNITKLNVSYRGCISVIPQSPNLINGSLRLNLDPSCMFTDTEIWHALDLMQMKLVISSLPELLENVITEGGSSFSIGERQLLHLARVVLKKSKIIVFDEATAKVDKGTVEMVQRIIRNVLKDCTVITISHRLSTILECDRIMVVDRGEVVEFDKPENLLAKDNTLC